MKKVLVTGAGGFIGSHLTEYLIDSGYFVKPMVRYKSEKNYGWLIDAIKSGKIKSDSIIFGDICDRGFVREAIEDSEIIFNLAALIGIPYSYKAMESYINVNIKGVFNILELSAFIFESAMSSNNLQNEYSSAHLIKYFLGNNCPAQ